MKSTQTLPPGECPWAGRKTFREQSQYSLNIQIKSHPPPNILSTISCSLHAQLNSRPSTIKFLV